MRFGVDWLKLGTVLAVLISATVLAAVGRIEAAPAVGMWGTVLGYVFGNGRLVAKGERPQPMLYGETREKGGGRRWYDPEVPPPKHTDAGEG